MVLNQKPNIKMDNYRRYVSEHLLPYRLINWGRNTGLSKCIGLVGPRGSGKSLSASAMGVLDYLIPGYNVISNMNLQYAVNINGNIINYQSEKLDKMEFMRFDIPNKTAVMVDEVNIEFSEGRRSMTNRNLIFNKIIQQLRKRKLNVIYTVQHEMWIDNRLRWQTDVFIKCQDVCMKPGGIYLPYDFGEFVSWKIYDMSGIFGRGVYADSETPLFDGLRFAGKQWWNTYDTDEIQEGDEGKYGKANVDESPYVQKKREEIADIQSKVLELHNDGIEAISSPELARILGVFPKKVKDILLTCGVTYNPYLNKYEIDPYDLEKMTDGENQKEIYNRVKV